MSLRRGVISLVGVLLVLLDAATATAGERLVFVGDVLLSRQVADELDARRGADPWAQMGAFFRSADFVMGNLEGAVGRPEECRSPAGLGGASPCFAVASARVALLRTAGFRALSIENNHAGDLGETGRDTTRRALRTAGVHPLTFADAPAFARVGGLVIALVAVNHLSVSFRQACVN